LIYIFEHEKKFKILRASGIEKYREKEVSPGMKNAFLLGTSGGMGRFTVRTFAKFVFFNNVVQPGRMNGAPQKSNGPGMT